MSQLFRKEALERRSRALFGDVVLSSPLKIWFVGLLVVLSMALIAVLLFGIDVQGESVWSWLRG